MEPAAAPIAMIPPFPLHACDVRAEVKVTAPFRFCRTGRRPGDDLAAEAEFVHAALAAVGAVQKKGHYRPKSYTQESKGVSDSYQVISRQSSQLLAYEPLFNGSQFVRSNY